MSDETQPLSLTDRIIDFETGQLPDSEVVGLFSELVKSGMAWTLQGVYGRCATSLIDEGYLAPDGTILKQME